MTLDQLNVNEKAIISGYLGNDISSARLLELGLMAGEPVMVIKKAPFGDPTEIRIMNYNLCLRKKEASIIEIQTNG